MYQLAADKLVQQYFTAVEKGKSSGNRGYRLPEVFVNRCLLFRNFLKDGLCRVIINSGEILNDAYSIQRLLLFLSLILNKKASQL